MIYPDWIGTYAEGGGTIVRTYAEPINISIEEPVIECEMTDSLYCEINDEPIMVIYG